MEITRNIVNQTISIVLLLISIYCLFNIDPRVGTYDVEPDYLMNALMIDKYGFPNFIYHPGTIHYYLVWFIYKLTYFLSLDLIELTLLIRFLYLSFGGFIILRYFRKNIFFILSTLAFIIFSGTFQIGLVSGETLIFFLSLIVLNEYLNKKRIVVIGLIFGLMMNIKSSSIFILPVIIFFEIFSFNKISIKRTYVFILISLTLFFTYLFVSTEKFLYPIKILFIKIFQIEKITHSRFINYSKLSENSKLSLEFGFYILLIILFIVTFFYCIKYKNYLLNFLNAKLFNNSKLISLIIVIIFSIYSVFTDGQMLRMFSSIIIFPFYFLLYKTNNKILLFTMISVILLLKIKNPIDYSISIIDNEISNKKEIVLYMNPGHWVSELFLIKWIEYIGLGIINIPNNWINKFGLENTDGIKLLNLENRDCNNLIELQNYPGPVEGLFRKDILKNCDSLLLEKTTSLIVPKEFYQTFDIFTDNYLSKKFRVETFKEKNEFTIFNIKKIN